MPWWQLLLRFARDAARSRRQPNSTARSSREPRSIRTLSSDLGPSLRLEFVAWVVAVIALSCRARAARTTDFQFSQELIDRGEATTLEAALRAALTRGDSIDNALWSLVKREIDLRQRGEYERAIALIGVVEAFSATAGVQRLPALYAGLGRGEVELRLGFTDLADRTRERLERLSASLAEDDPQRGIARAACGLFVLDCALATESFDRVVREAEALRASLEPATWEHFGLEIESRAALAEFGLARRDPSRIERAIVPLRKLVDSQRLNAESRARQACSLAELEWRRGDITAALSILDGIALSPAGDQKPVAPDLVAQVTAQRIAMRLDRGVAARELARDALALTGALDRILERSTGPSRLERNLDDSGGPPGFLHFGALQDALATRVRLSVEEQDLEGAVDWILRAQSAGWLARGKRVRLSEVREHVLVSDDHVLLIFLPAPTRSALFAITRSDLAFHELPSILEQKRARRVIEEALVRDPRSAIGFERKHELSDAARAFVPSALVERLRGVRRMSITALGPLATLPFEALRIEEQALGARFDVDRIPSLPLAVAVGRDGRGAQRGIPGVGDVVRVLAPIATESVRERFPEVVDLAFALPSVAAVDGVWGDRVVDTRAGANAAFPESFEVVPTIVEFFSHGVLLDEILRPNALVLAPSRLHPDGLIDSRAFESWSAPRLVILAACSTAYGPYRAGNEIATSLTGTLLDRGVECVIASSRRVEGRAMLRMVEAIHRHLALGASPAQALRAARCERWADGSNDDLAVASLVSVIGCGQRELFDSAPPRPSERSRDSDGRSESVPARIAVIVFLFSVGGLGWSRLRRRHRAGRAFDDGRDQ